MLIDLASYRAMTHMNCRQWIPARLDQYVNHDPRLMCKARLVFKARPLLAQLRQTPGLYSRPGLYLRPGFYSRKYGMCGSGVALHQITLTICYYYHMSLFKHSISFSA